MSLAIATWWPQPPSSTGSSRRPRWDASSRCCALAGPWRSGGTLIVSPGSATRSPTGRCRCSRGSTCRRRNRWAVIIRSTPISTSVVCRRRGSPTSGEVFRRDRTLNVAQVRALYESNSFVRAVPSAERRTLLAGLDDLAQRRFAGAAPNVVLSALYLARASA